MNLTRSPVDSLACVNIECDLYAQPGKENLVIRKTYGVDQIRYLRCYTCGQEFSERKQSALWNVKVPEARAVAALLNLSMIHPGRGTDLCFR